MIKTLLFAFAAICLGVNALHADTNGKQQTLAIIKPDAVKDNHIGDITAMYEKNNLKIAALLMTQLDKEEAGEFYAVHKGKPFFEPLVEFMSSGPIVVLVLEGDNAIAKNRELMGATDPKQAAEGTIRKKFAKSKGENAVHGSDSPEAAKQEIDFFFAKDEIYSR